MEHRWLTIDYEPNLAESDTVLRAVVQVAPAGLDRAGARLRVQTLPSGRVKSLKQIKPSLLDITALGVPVSSVVSDYPLSLGDEVHVYELSLTLRPEPPGDRIRAALLTLLIEQQEKAKQGLLVEWTENPESVPTIRTGPTMEEPGPSEPTVRTAATEQPAALADQCWPESKEGPR
jgi:hypothetical protein